MEYKERAKCKICSQKFKGITAKQAQYQAMQHILARHHEMAYEFLSPHVGRIQ